MQRCITIGLMSLCLYSCRPNLPPELTEVRIGDGAHYISSADESFAAGYPQDWYAQPQDTAAINIANDETLLADDALHVKTPEQVEILIAAPDSTAVGFATGTFSLAEIAQLTAASLSPDNTNVAADFPVIRFTLAGREAVSIHGSLNHTDGSDYYILIVDGDDHVVILAAVSQSDIRAAFESSLHEIAASVRLD